MPSVRVSLVTPGGEVVSGDLVSHQPRQGFMVNRGAVLPSSNLQCQFSDNQRSETVKVQMISSNNWDHGNSEARVEVSLTLVQTDADLELDRIQLVCKGRSIFDTKTFTPQTQKNSIYFMVKINVKSYC